MNIQILQVYIHPKHMKKRKAFDTEQSLIIFSKSNRNASHKIVKDGISRLFSHKNPGNSLSVEGLSHQFWFPWFNTRGKCFLREAVSLAALCSWSAWYQWEFRRHVIRGIGLFWAVGKRSCLLLLPKTDTKDTKDFYYTCHIRWSKLKMELKPPLWNKRLFVCFKGILCCVTWN